MDTKYELLVNLAPHEVTVWYHKPSGCVLLENRWFGSIVLTREEIFQIAETLKRKIHDDCT